MKNTTALITGSYGGFGRCLVNIHAEKGGDVILVGRSPEKLEEQAREVAEKYHVKAYTIAADLSQPDSAQRIYDECKQNGWEVDYLINNAGFGGKRCFKYRSRSGQRIGRAARNRRQCFAERRIYRKNGGRFQC